MKPTQSFEGGFQSNIHSLTDPVAEQETSMQVFERLDRQK
jgi:hypothetical protein